MPRLSGCSPPCPRPAGPLAPRDTPGGGASVACASRGAPERSSGVTPQSLGLRGRSDLVPHRGDARFTAEWCASVVQACRRAPTYGVVLTITRTSSTTRTHGSSRAGLVGEDTAMALEVFTSRERAEAELRGMERLAPASITRVPQTSTGGDSPLVNQTRHCPIGWTSSSGTS